MNESIQVPLAAPTTTTFDNITMYRDGMIGLARIDCRSMTVTTGVKFAQYNDAVRVEYVEKGKRKGHSFMLGHGKWLRVVDTANAIDTQALVKMPSVPGSGVECRQSRYASCDPRWETDFEDELARLGISVLYSIGAGEREGELVEQYRKMRP